MNLTTEQLDKLTELAAALLPPDEIAILLELPPDQHDRFCEIVRNHQASPVYTAYHSGRLQTKFELRKMVIKLAKAGSPAAQPIAEKYLLNL